MNQKIYMLACITFIFLGISLFPQDYRVTIEISLIDQEVENLLRTKQKELNDKLVNTFFAEIDQSPKKLTSEYQQYKLELKKIINQLKADHYKSSNLKQLNGRLFANGTNKPFHLTLTYIDNLIHHKDLKDLKQTLTDAAQEIIIQFPNGLGDFYIQGAPSFIGENGWIAYQEITDAHKNLEKIATIISNKLKNNTTHTINKDYPILKPHISIGLIGHMAYPPKVLQKTNPFYKKLLENHVISPNNSLWSGMQKAIETNGRIANNKIIKFNVKNFTLKIADLRNPLKTIHSELIYELPSGLAAQLSILKSKLEHLKSKLFLLHSQLKTLKTQLTTPAIF